MISAIKIDMRNKDRSYLCTQLLLFVQENQKWRTHQNTFGWEQCSDCKSKTIKSEKRNVRKDGSRSCRFDSG